MAAADDKNNNMLVSASGSDDAQEAALRKAFALGAGRQAWQHQIEAVQCLLRILTRDTEAAGVQSNMLVQHAAGSGKSMTMALLVHVLHTLRDSNNNSQGRRVALIMLLSDRLQLDQQLGDTVEGFLRRAGTLQGEFRRADLGGLSIAKALGDAAADLGGRCLVVAATKQKFERLLRHKQGTSSSDGLGHAGLLAPILGRGRVVLICEECHRAHFHGSATALAVARLFGSGSGLGRQQPQGLTYIGFSATPNARALRFFGRAGNLQASGGEARLCPSHCYHLGQAERDGVVLHVLENYQSFDFSQDSIDRKAAWLLDDLAGRAAQFPLGFARVLKAMVVCRSRADVVAYVAALRNQLALSSMRLPEDEKATPSPEGCYGVFGFFSGEICGESEDHLNARIQLKDASKLARILVVCNKLETGYDEPRLAVLYLDRRLESAVTAVQVLSRVNRHAAGKSRAFVTDFHGRQKEAGESLAAFRTEVTLATSPGRSEEMAPLWELEAQLQEIVCGRKAASAEAAQSLFTKYKGLCKQLRMPCSKRLARFVTVSAAASTLAALGSGAQDVGSFAAAAAAPVVFVEEQVAQRLLGG
ncbi:unnamed protein product [Polarella glacialis]|uniref:Helicase ATP-binding domain-containing protein n=1 Tax=Polarella glacialis TaxID=89957 RepID=A0A813HGY1_POLGL|nr:unnamed protein product [Polarella glacialis]